MAYHIPFNQRNRRPPVVYIGFDRNRPPRRKFNWWGFNGLLLSLAAFFTAGALSPIALLVNMVGLRRKPRKMAVAGTLFSLAGCGLMVALVVGGISHQAQLEKLAKARIYQQQYQQNAAECDALIEQAFEEFDEYRIANDGQLPKWVEGNMLMIKYVDPWGKQLSFDAKKGFALIRSAGPDGEYDTGDDLTKRIDGETDQEVYLPVD